VISSYVVFAVCFSVAFSSAQRLSFVQLNLSNLHGATFVLFCLVLLLPSINYEQFITLNVINHSFYSSFFQISLLVVIICFFILINEYVKVKNLVKFEYCLVILFALLGLLLIISSETLLTFYLAIELQSLCFYILAVQTQHSNPCAESALKYFVLGAFSSGLLLIAFALLYSSFGTICFESFERICSLSSSLNAFSGSFIFFVALLFKFGSFPFHL
jgi:NADH-quinone oxidoreductase subunit N